MTRIDQYLEKSEEIILLSQSEEIEAVRVLLKATKSKRNKIRESKPKYSPDDLEEDIIFQLGMVKALNWVLGLPARSRHYIDNLK